MGAGGPYPRCVDRLTPSARAFIESGVLAHLITLNQDGTPHVTLTWIGTDDEKVVFATFPDQRKLDNMRRDPRVTLSMQAREQGDEFLLPYLVVQGRARVTEGGALEVMDRLANHYIGPGAKFPMRDAPPGFVTHVTVERIYGVGSWKEAQGA